jgi:hypothetical protein
MTVSRTVQVQAPAQRVWELVSDLPEMGRLSDENVGGAWRRGATGPAVGARFRGKNANGKRRWSTDVLVTRCEPGKAFAFEVSSFGIPVSAWSYDVVADGESSCSVTESWTDRRPGWFKKPAGVVTGVMQRDEEASARSMERTLEALRQLAERPAQAN